MLCLWRLRVIPSPQGNKTFGRTWLLSAMRHQTFTTFALLLVLAAGCGGKAVKQAQPEPPPAAAAAQTCAAGAVRHLGSAKVAYAAIVRTQASASSRPGGRVFA